MNLPDYNFLSAPLWLITTLHVLTLSLHFAAMNFVLGGIIILLAGNFTHRWENPTVRLFVRLFPTAMAAVVTLGVAPLLFLQLVYPRQTYAAAIVSGWFWLMVAPMAIVSYYSLYAASLGGDDKVSRTRILLMIALLGLFYVSLVYSSVFSMAERPGLIRELYAGRQTGLEWNPRAGGYFWRWLHMVLGAVTVGGFFVGLLGRDNPPAFAVGKRTFLWGMIFAAAAGLAYLTALGEQLVPFMRTPAVWTLLMGILLAAGSMHFFFQRKFLASGVMLFVSLVSMVINRHYVRLIELGGKFDPASWRIQPQWSVFTLFLISFVLAFGLIAYMLFLFFGRRKTVG